MEDPRQDAPAGSDEGGFYCSTSGTTFTEREALADHYKSDLHRYNLKRKVAGLPPVTTEWFEARRDQLESLQSKAQAEADKVFVCPLTNKRFQSEGTYESHTRTKKFKEALKKAQLTEAPPPKVVTRPAGQAAAAQVRDVAAVTSGLGRLAMQEGSSADADDDDDDDADDDAEGSGWETDTEAEGDEEANASGSSSLQADGEADSEADWAEWDVRRSLFDNHVAPSFEKNLEYMYKHFGFTLPDPPCLRDPEGMLRYLGAKLQYGHVPLYSRGDDADAKQFGSVHAVQRHMVDSNRCGVCYDGNEDEYDEFYDYGAMETGELQASNVVDVTAASELVLSGGADGRQAQVLGSRGFKHLYRQRHRPEPSRTVARQRELALAHGSQTNGALVASYRKFGAPEVGKEELQKRAARRNLERRRDWGRMKSEIANDKIYKLPKNVTY